MSRGSTIAIIGAGLQGVCTALELDRRGYDVQLVDQDDVAVNRASLRNEGKVHLGLVYANDPTPATADLMLDGALRFGPLVSRWTNGEHWLTPSNRFHYLVAHDSMVGVGDLAEHYEHVQARYRSLLDDDPTLDYLGRRPDVLSSPIADLADTPWPTHTVAAAFSTAELALDLTRLATALRDALAGSTVTFLRGRRAVGVERTPHGLRVQGASGDGSWSIDCDQVVNSAWDGRLAIDATMDLLPTHAWLYRLKHRVLVHLPPELQVRPSITIVLGKYGDVVVHTDGSGYVSWYPECMRHTSEDVFPPATWEQATRGSVDEATGADIAAKALAATDEWFPGLAAAAAYHVDAGVIFAWGSTDIDDQRSELHRRDSIGVESFDGYHTVNTGKLTTAPMFAEETADRVGKS